MVATRVRWQRRIGGQRRIRWHGRISCNGGYSATAEEDFGSRRRNQGLQGLPCSSLFATADLRNPPPPPPPLFCSTKPHRNVATRRRPSLGEAAVCVSSIFIANNYCPSYLCFLVVAHSTPLPVRASQGRCNVTGAVSHNFLTAFSASAALASWTGVHLRGHPPLFTS